MQVLVTGGLGYIGSHTSVLLLEKGYDLVIVDDLSNSNEKVIENIFQITSKVPVFEKIDLKDKESVSKLFNNYDFDGIIHFAAHKSVNESVNYPDKYFKNNVGSLENIIYEIENQANELGVFGHGFTYSAHPLSAAVALKTLEIYEEKNIVDADIYVI